MVRQFPSAEPEPKHVDVNDDCEWGTTLTQPGRAYDTGTPEERCADGYCRIGVVASCQLARTGQAAGCDCGMNE